MRSIEPPLPSQKLSYLSAGWESMSGEQTSGTQSPPKGTMPSLDFNDKLPGRAKNREPKEGSHTGNVRARGWGGYTQ